MKANQLIYTSVTHIVVIVLLFWSIPTISQNKIVYKTVDDVDLLMYKYDAKSLHNSSKPAILFFFGGGWNKGTYTQFEPHAKYFSKRGLTCFLVDYRVKNRHNSTPFESLKDAKSAIRFVRSNAKQFKIDTNKIIAAGASAGGQLAAAATFIDKYNEQSDDITISSKANALVLFNPAIDNGPGGIGYERVADDYLNFSPLHNIKKGAPPTIIFLGTKDKLIPVETCKQYQQKMESMNSRCELYLYDGKKHGFFNYKFFKEYKNTIQKTDAFLQSLGYLKENPKISIE